MEKVVNTAPNARAAVKENSSGSGTAEKNEDATHTVKKSRKKESKQTETVKPARPPSVLDGQLDSLQSTIRAMNVRMKILLEFLQKVEKGGEVPRDDTLLRSIDGLLKKFIWDNGVIMLLSELENE